jgi:YfiR/HmsC-like
MPGRQPSAGPPAPRARGRLGAAVLALAWGVLMMSEPQPGLAEPLAEYEIKAAFVYNFAKFVQWPAGAFGQPESPLILCLIGEDRFGPALEALDHKIAQGHELRVRRQIRLEDARSCHVLLIAESERARVASILRAVSGASVLTVSDVDRFAESGGIIGLYNLDNKVQFSVNLEQARNASLQINSQLLKLAKIVGPEARKDGP